MNSPKDPEIRLFGRMIAFPENGRSSASITADERPCESGGAADCDVNDAELRAEEKVDDEIEKLLQTEKEDVCETKMQEKEQNPCGAEESQNPCISSELDENPKTPSIHEDATSENEQTNGQQKVLKKPDKIIPCPRCNSMETKFCYYNNYNVNQPRHFCKSCQRYWTAGGTMRNVPVGAGRRKNKNLASNCCHITISEALQAARMDSPNGFHHQAFKHNGTVLSFGPDSQLCESMEPALNCSEKQAPNRDDSSMGSSVTTSSSVQKRGENCPQQTVMPNLNGFPFPVPCIPGVAWQFPWNSALPMPAICPPGYPMPFYATPYWNVPWGSLSPTVNQMGSNSNPNSPLGKHSRNGELLNPNGLEKQGHFEPKNSESSIVVPKTLRIDDPEEAAKSSIWETLGIKYNSVSREGLFKALQPKGDEKQAMVSTSPVLQANPAALSRSISFQETYSSNASSQVINP